MSSEEPRLVDRLLEEFMDRQRNGENPTVDEYCARHPDLADEIRDVFEAVLMMEQLKPGSRDESGTLGGDVGVEGQSLDQVGDYRILGEIGRGGMGVVYEAEQISLGRRVALKVLPRQMAGNAKSLARFRREAKAAARMHHTNIVPVFDVGTDSEHVFYAMQLIRGQGLDLVIKDLRRLRRESVVSRSASAAGPADAGQSPPAASIAHSLVSGHFQPERLDNDAGAEFPRSDAEGPYDTVAEAIGSQTSSNSSASLPGKSDISTAESDRCAYFVSVAHIGQQTANALSYAHARGIIHRDIKPSNLLLDAAGVVWVVDFGLAKTGDSTMTHTGDILGTLRYMSPERFRGQCDVRADVYSLGVTLYELLTLRHAFVAKDQASLINRINEAEPTALREIDASVPRDLETIVLKAIDKDPKRRYQSADELEEDLQRFIDDKPIKARRISLRERFARWRRRNRSLATALAVVATLLLVINVVVPTAAWRWANLNDQLETTVDDLQSTQTQLTNERDDARQAREEAIEAEQRALAQREETRRSLYFANISMAQTALAAGDIRRHQRLLARWRTDDESSDLRGFEWYYLLSQGHDKHQILRGHTDDVRAVAWHPSGQRAASGSFDKSIKIWGASSGRSLRSITGVSGEFSGTRAVAWSPDGQRLASSHRSSFINIWEAESGRELMTLAGHFSAVLDVAWSPDGSRLASAGWDGTLRLWDAETGRQTALLEHPGMHICCVAWHLDGTQIATGCHNDPVIRIWDANTGKRIDDLRGHTRNVWDLAWHSDGKQFASAGGDGEVYIWDLDSKTVVQRFVGHAQAVVRTVAWNPIDDSKLLTVSGDTTVRIWDASTMRQLHSFGGHTDMVFAGAWRPDGKQIASGSADDTVRIWDVPSELLGKRTACHTSAVQAIAWSPDGAWMASAANDGSTKIWQDRGEKLLHTLVDEEEPQTKPRDVAFSTDGKRVASGGEDGFVRIWEVASGKLLHRLARHEANQRNASNRGVQSLAWHPDGVVVVSAGHDETIRVWNSITGELLESFEPTGGATYDICFSPDGKSMISGHWIESPLLIWDTATWTQVGVFDSGGIIVWEIEFSPDGQRLAVAGGRRVGKEDGIATNFGAIKIWNWDALRSDDRAFAEIEISGLRDVVLQVAWSPDGRRLASAGLRNAATLWDVSPGNTDSETRELMTFPSSMGNGRSLCFSPDGSRLVRSSGKSIDVYDAYDGYVLEKSQQLLPTLDARILAGTASAKDFRLRAEVHAAGGEWSAAATSYDHFSLLGENHKFILAGVWVSGYFPGELERPFAPEMLSGHDFNPRDVYEQPTGEACWQRIDERQGAINFGILLGHRSGQTAYAMFRVYSLRTQEAGILLGDDDFHRLWVNGSVVSEDAVKGPAKSDEFAIPITLERGWNSILAKVVDAGDGSQDSHGLFLRISDDPAELATVFMRREEYAEALPAWDWAVEAHPDDESLLLKRAQTQWKLGEHDAAEADFAAFLAGREDDALAIESRARVYLELLRDEGHAEYDRAVRSAPNLLGLRNRCADSKISHDRLAEALDHLQFLVSMAPEDLLKCWELAVVLLELDDEIGYRKLRTEMLSRWKDARNPVTAANVSTIALIIPADEDELAIAVALAEVAVESADDDEIRWIGLNADGLAKYRQGELAEARSDFDSANEYFTRAKQRLTSALEEMPRARLTTRIQATYRLAATLFHLKDEAGARKALRTADDEFSQFDQGADVGPYACRLTRAEAHYKLNN